MNKIIFLGDITGRTGRRMVQKFIPILKERYNPDLLIANIENASGGLGVDQRCIKELLKSGIQVMTSGNHIWSRREIYKILDVDSSIIIRPANYPEGAPGVGFTTHTFSNGKTLTIVNLIGRVFINDLTDCPFRKADQIISNLSKKIDHILVDFHAEATSEKVAMGYFLNGKVSAVVGTHTHVQTADEKILDMGTAFITDVGMCGPYDSIIGAEIGPILSRFTTGLPSKFESKKGRGQLNGVLIELADEKRKSNKIERINISENEEEC